MATVVSLFAGATFNPETRVTFTKNDVLVLDLTLGVLLVVAPMIYNGRRSLEAIVSAKGLGNDGSAIPLGTRLPCQRSWAVWTGAYAELRHTGVLGSSAGIHCGFIAPC